MIDEIVSLETAKLAKEKGFNISCRNRWREPETISPKPWIQGGYYSAKTIDFPTYFHESNKVKYTLAPTQSLLQRWLREVHRINVESNWLPNISVYRTLFKPMDLKFFAPLANQKQFDKYYDKTNYDTYEKALEAGLLQGLKLIK